MSGMKSMTTVVSGAAFLFELTAYLSPLTYVDLH